MDTKTSTLQKHSIPNLTFEGFSFALHLAKAELSYVSTSGGGSKTFSVARQTDDAGCLAARSDELDVSVAFQENDGWRIEPELAATYRGAVRVNRLRLVWTLQATEETGRTSFSFFKNGWQSWTMSRSYRPEQRERVPFVPFANAMQDNPRNLSSGKTGEFCSDTFALMEELSKNEALFVGQSGEMRQFFYIRAAFGSKQSGVPTLEFQWDLDGKELQPGERLALDAAEIFVGDHPNRLMDRYFEAQHSPRPMAETLPTGWCSWYHYYTKVNEDAVRKNLETVESRQPGWSVFVLDDGYQTVVGDWLSLNEKFPSGLKAVVDAICERGMTPGIWLAPFSALDRSQLFKDHSDWTLKDDRGRPVQAGWNPLWHVFGHFYAMDTTNPGFQDYLRRVIRTFVHEFGFRYLKLDFLYSTALHGQAYDPSLSPAERLQLGLQIIREEAGDDVFLLGCGCPLGAASKIVDAMRIGPDVAPFWFDPIRYHLTRDPHALCTKFAIRSVLVRAAMHRRWWLNDPDCLMLRDTDTKLTLDERMALAHAIVITGGMYLVSDDLALLPDATWNVLDRIEGMVRDCDRGRAWTLDLMEREFPELVYNSSGYLAVFNLSDRPRYKTDDLNPYLADVLEENASFEDVWTGEVFSCNGTKLDLGLIRPHASRLLKLREK